MSAALLTDELVPVTSQATDDAARAAALYAQTRHLVLARAIQVGDLMGRVGTLATLGDTAGGAELYRTWIALNPGHPLLTPIYFNYSVLLSNLNELPAAVIALRTAIQINPDFYPSYINLGSVLDRLGMQDQAVAEWTSLVTRLESLSGNALNYKNVALNQAARVLQALSRPAEAEDNLRQSLDINPHQPEVLGHLVALRQQQCKWPVIVVSERLTRAQQVAAMPPLAVFNYTDDAMFQLARAYAYNLSAVGRPAVADLIPPGAAPHGRPQKLRIGYVSSDLRAHAVGFAMADVIETHDRGEFDIYAYYCGIDREDPIKSRIRNAADHWLDINGLDDAAAAARIAADGIDILVDLNGYTKDARTRVFSRRPAPIAANWFGFPGTMGSPYHHYIIADDYLIPPDHDVFYSEKIVRLPCYQPNDRSRVVATTCPTRSEVGLPEQGFVYCCLNGMQKMPPLTFARWMEILQQVPDSVLWLLKGSDETNQRVHQMAAQHGVAAERLVFADRANNPEHLARYALADLFLDTLPYGAHTTASDALYMGVPVLTVSGRSFASRVCGSVVRAAGLPEMICTSTEHYVARAIALGRYRTPLDGMRRRLLENRSTSLLFDTRVLVRALETQYWQMWDEYARGERPVPDLRNLPVYHDIGVELELDSMELLGETEYRGLYRQKLADLHAVEPLGPDGRFWQSTYSRGQH